MIHGRRYGDYELIKEIGKGGYGEVHLTVNKSNGKEFAMKILDKNKIAKESLEDDVIAEVRSMKLVHHPFIVRLFEVLKSNKKILLLMEYMDGGDLFDAIKAEETKRMSEAKSRVYFQQIIMAVDYLHKKNIIHRDLKPENILVDKKNNCIKITDFGLSTLISKKNQIIPDLAGTTDYLAPEVIKQTGYLGQKADIWSCGVILFNCVTGNKPFWGRSSDMLNNILSGNVEFSTSKMSVQLIDLLTKILDPNPKTRYSIDEIIQHPWFQEGLYPVKKFLDEWLLKNKEDNIYAESASIVKKTLKNINTIYYFPSHQDGAFFEVDDLQLINCFELGAILYGNCINSMFENKRNTFEKATLKFISNEDIGSSCNLIQNFFKSERMDSDFSIIEKCKVLINVFYKNSNTQLFLQVYKLSKTKFIFVFTYQSGIMTEFYKMMALFFSQTKSIFALF